MLCFPHYKIFQILFQEKIQVSKKENHVEIKTILVYILPIFKIHCLWVLIQRLILIFFFFLRESVFAGGRGSREEQREQERKTLKQTPHTPQSSTGTGGSSSWPWDHDLHHFKNKMSTDWATQAPQLHQYFQAKCCTF